MDTRTAPRVNQKCTAFAADMVREAEELEAQAKDLRATAAFVLAKGQPERNAVTTPTSSKGTETQTRGQGGGSGLRSSLRSDRTMAVIIGGDPEAPGGQPDSPGAPQPGIVPAEGNPPGPPGALPPTDPPPTPQPIPGEGDGEEGDGTNEKVARALDRLGAQRSA